MKSLLGMVIPLMACTPPAPSPESYRPLKVDSRDYWEPTLKSVPTGFKFPSNPATSEKVVIDVDTQIDKQGHPTAAKAIAQSSAFALPAENYVMACEFQPAKFDGKWTDCTFRIKVIFNTPKHEIHLRTNNDKQFRPLDSQ
ncbi:energy transducer TonB [Geothrix alkalitolerans]|uniref:energy transducer TonB n=1 Tax=Geothrix alkalitolerans TaxID=2922724 RepID=UPI001FAFF0A9|nr:energy transducer TonB [Geothrix alkalitolerans]